MGVGEGAVAVVFMYMYQLQRAVRLFIVSRSHSLSRPPPRSLHPSRKFRFVLAWLSFDKQCEGLSKSFLT